MEEKNTDQGTVKHSSAYWEAKKYKCELKIRSLERQLENTDVSDPDWEELYALLMNTRENARAAFWERHRALQEEGSLELK